MQNRHQKTTRHKVVVRFSFFGGFPSIHLVALTKGVDTHTFLSWTFSHACHQKKTTKRFQQRILRGNQKHVCVFFRSHLTKSSSKDTALFSQAGERNTSSNPTFPNHVEPTKSESSKPMMGHIHLSRMAPCKKLPSTCPTRVGSSARLLAEGPRENQGQ